jgi:muconolactone delta-isomerase
MRSNEDTVMEFLVEFELEILDSAPGSEVSVRKKSEVAAVDALAERGHLVRLWRTFLSTGPVTILGLYRADGQAELNELLATLPLYEWMRTTVTPLFQHPNDPAKRERALGLRCTPSSHGADT